VDEPPPSSDAELPSPQAVRRMAAAREATARGTNDRERMGLLV
jgi:hypothetical protein